MNKTERAVSMDEPNLYDDEDIYDETPEEEHMGLDLVDNEDELKVELYEDDFYASPGDDKAEQEVGNSVELTEDFIEKMDNDAVADTTVLEDQTEVQEETLFQQHEHVDDRGDTPEEKYFEPTPIETRELDVEVTISNESPKEGRQELPSDVTATASVWKELQVMSELRDKAVAEAYQQSKRIMELNAAIAKQDEEINMLRATENESQSTFAQVEVRLKELAHQNAMLQQENRLMKEDATHLNSEIGKRGMHFKEVLDKWTEAQSENTSLEKENALLKDKIKDLRQRYEADAVELENTKDERDCLQREVHQLKGRVAAKTAEAKALLTYGNDAREHLQSQSASIQRHQYRQRKLNAVACDALFRIQNVRRSLATVRAPILSLREDFQQFIRHLRQPVLQLLSRSKQYATAAHSERQPLKDALTSSDLARKHLHDQLWESKHNAIVLCQIRSAAHPLHAYDNAGQVKCPVLRANYSTGEVLLRTQPNTEPIHVQFDAVYSDRSRPWRSDESITPLLQSIIDGSNGCIVVFDGMLPLQLHSDPPLASLATHSDEISPVELIMHQLFDIVETNGHAHRAAVTVSFMAVYDEVIYDLLGTQGMVQAYENRGGTSTCKFAMLEVSNLEEVLLVLRSGYDTLQATQSFPMNHHLAHRVITLDITYENRLVGAVPVKSKLQIVELAAQSRTEPTPDLEWQRSDESKVVTTMEQGIKSLISVLADIRFQETTFVRYHSSKLTVLLQETMKASAKFLAIGTFPEAFDSDPKAAPGSSLSSQTSLATMHWMQQIIAAVRDPVNGFHGKRDGTLQGFMSRYAKNKQLSGNGSLTTGQLLTFSSSALRERKQKQMNRRIGSISWERELESMEKRYGTELYRAPLQLAAHPTIDESEPLNFPGNSRYMEHLDQSFPPSPVGAQIYPHASAQLEQRRRKSKEYEDVAPRKSAVKRQPRGASAGPSRSYQNRTPSNSSKTKSSRSVDSKTSTKTLSAIPSRINSGVARETAASQSSKYQSPSESRSRSRTPKSRPAFR